MRFNHSLTGVFLSALLFSIIIASPLTNYKRDASDPGFDTQACVYQSGVDLGFAVGWHILLPQWNGADPNTAQTEFYNAVRANSACNSVPVPGWQAVGAQSTTKRYFSRQRISALTGR